MAERQCSVTYHKTPHSKLATFGTGVRDGQFNNPLKFPIVPVSKVDFEDHISNYETSYKAYKNGGISQKGQFLLDKGILIGDLDKFAVSTDKSAAGNADLIILGGFVPTDGVDTKSIVPDTPVASLERGKATGVLLAESNVIIGAVSYGAILCIKPFSAATLIDKSGQLTLGTSDFFMKLDLTKSRKKQFVGLTAGNIYYIYFYASNTAGVSQLSKVESIMCA